IEVEQLPGQLAGGAARAGLYSLPARRPQRRELWRLAPRADVTSDLRELVGRREDAIRAAVGKLQVVAGDACDGLRLEAVEASDPVVLVDDVVADPQVREGRQPPARGRRGGLPSAVTKPSASLASAKTTCSAGGRDSPSRNRASRRFRL